MSNNILIIQIKPINSVILETDAKKSLVSKSQTYLKLLQYLEYLPTLYIQGGEKNYIKKSWIFKIAYNNDTIH